MTYLEMVNEVLVRMREDEVLSVNDVENDPQQKLVCKFVNDARRFVDKSHTWNAQRKAWFIDLDFDKAGYVIPDSNEAGAIYTVRWAGSNQCLKEVNERYLSQQKKKLGKPHYYNCGWTQDNEMVVRLWPVPGTEYRHGTGAVSEFNIGEYYAGRDQDTAEYNGEFLTEQNLLIEGYTACRPLKEDDDKIELPTDPVMYYALAYASRERGEVGGQSSAELFQIAAQYLSDSIAWDVNNSDLEYVWRQA